jgi:Tfp pilus assembly protein PilX
MKQYQYVYGKTNQRGNVLVTVILMMAVLVGLGTTAVVQTSTDMNISTNYRLGEEAFYAAEAAAEEARARLRGSNTDPTYAGDPATALDTWWSAYILSGTQQPTDDPNYSALYRNYVPTTSSHTSTTVTANSLQSTIPYMVKIKHKLEYDAEQRGHKTSTPMYYDGDGNTGTNPSTAPGNIIYYGYGNPSQPTTAVQFTTSGGSAFKPVNIITAYGMVGNSIKTVEVEVTCPPGPPIKAAIYAKGDVTGNGTALTVDGNDNCGVTAPLDTIYTMDPSITNLNGLPTMNPTPPAQGTDNIDIIGTVESMKSGANVIITTDETGTTFGSASNYVTCYSDTSNPYNNQGLKLTDCIGYGTLLVKGDLKMSGTFTWDGLILVTGTLTFNGGGATGINIQGAVLANQTVDLNGGVNVTYNSCSVNNALSSQPVTKLSWREITH